MENKKMVLSMCICETCPSWKKCNNPGKEKGFCFQTIGKSKCIHKENGCICSGCPITAKMGLKHVYYCTRGSEIEQLKKFKN